MLTFAAAYVLYITFELPLVFIESLFLPTRPNSEIQNNTSIHINGVRNDVIVVKYNDVLMPSAMKSTWNEPKPSSIEEKENGELSKL